MAQNDLEEPKDPNPNLDPEDTEDPDAEDLEDIALITLIVGHSLLLARCCTPEMRRCASVRPRD